jgi:hypothetical protein
MSRVPIRNTTKTLLHLFRGHPPLEAGEVREFDEELVDAAMGPGPNGRPSRYAHLVGRVIEVGEAALSGAQRAPVEAAPRTDDAVAAEVRAEVAKMLTLTRDPERAAASTASAPDSPPTSLAHLTVSEAATLVAGTSDLDLLSAWSSDTRKGVQRAIDARMDELAAGPATGE